MKIKRTTLVYQSLLQGRERAHLDLQRESDSELCQVKVFGLYSNVLVLPGLNRDTIAAMRDLLDEALEDWPVLL